MSDDGPFLATVKRYHLSATLYVVFANGSAVPVRENGHKFVKFYMFWKLSAILIFPPEVPKYAAVYDPTLELA